MAKNKKDSSEKENIEELKKSLKPDQNKQVFWAMVLMISMIAIIILVPVIIKSWNNFEYLGLDFTKTKSGDVILYSTNIPVGDLDTQQVTGAYDMAFREDPRKLEYILINITNNNTVTFNQKKTVYISVDPDMKACEDNTLAVVNLVQFLGRFGGLEIASAGSNQEYAIEKNVTYANCYTNQTNTVIALKSGEVSQINKVGSNCYELIYADCELLPVTERFVTLILEKYMTLFVKV